MQPLYGFLHFRASIYCICDTSNETLPQLNIIVTAIFENVNKNWTSSLLFQSLKKFSDLLIFEVVSKIDERIFTRKAGK